MAEMRTELYDRKTSEEFYDERYKTGYMDEWPPEKKHRVAEVVRALDLPSSGEALDFGCGNGIFTEVIRQALPGWRVYGMDFSSVAIQGAKAQYPGCTFFTNMDTDLMNKKFDFLFTHHVLEHVYKLDVVWRELATFMKPNACSLHILPCGNEGSFEHQICQLRTDGINAEMENRFFFEDEGHVRRLTTSQMVELAHDSGMELVREYYANQYHGALDWISGAGEDFLLMLTETRYAKDSAAESKLLRIRKDLKPAVWARDLLAGVKDRKAHKNKTLRNWAGLMCRLPLVPLCRTIDRRVRRASELEWKEKNHEPSGSEMYLHFRRINSPASQL
jgi:trans-aconitate methyltransferase